jgi:hypothetical protein
MKILNKSDNIIIEVEDKTRIEKLLGYPDKFEIVKEENNEPAYFKSEEIENNNIEEENNEVKPKRGKRL